MNRRQHRRRASRRYRSRRRSYKNGVCRAARRALAAGVMYLDNKGLTLRMAAELCGSNVAYVQAAIIILQTEDLALRDAVLSGKVPLLTAAAAMKSTAKLISAYRASDGADKFALGQAVTPEKVWTATILPVLNTETHESAPTMEDDLSVSLGD